MFMKRLSNVTSFPPLSSSDVLFEPQSSVATTHDDVKNFSEIQFSSSQRLDQWPNQRARRLEPKCALLRDELARRLLERARRLRSREEVHVDAADAAGAELDVAGAGPVVRAGFARRPAASRSAPRRRRAPRPRRRPPPSAPRPSRRLRPRTRRETSSRASASHGHIAVLGHSARRRLPRERGASGRRGRGRRAARCRRRAPRRCAPDRESSRGGRRRTRCHARRKPSSSARGRIRRRRDGRPERDDERDLAVVADAARPTDSRAAATPPRSAPADT